MVRYMGVLAVGLLICSQMAVAGGALSVVLTRQVVNTVSENIDKEGNSAIMAAKKDYPDLGSMVYIYLKNRSDSTVQVKNLKWNGSDVNSHLAAPDYDAIWWRCSPQRVKPGEECEITICLRESLKKDTEFTVSVDNGSEINCSVRAEDIGPRMAAITFENGLKCAYLYVESNGQSIPSRVYINSRSAGRSAVLLGGKTVNGVAVYKITPGSGFKRGEFYVFRVGDKKSACAAAIRAFDGIVRSGMWGAVDISGYGGAGFDAYNSFGKLDTKTLNDFASAGMKAGFHTGFNPPEKDVIGHPGIYAYLPVDEPDCGDYSADEKRPMHKRIGTLAQNVAMWAQQCVDADRLTPAMVTMDLTFTPYNYFVYSKTGDIANPDCYTVTIGWPLTSFRDKVSIVKRASAPQPFAATYQGCWEEFATTGETWIGHEALGRDLFKYLDRKKIRGFGRAPSPEEGRIPMLYALGSGAKALFCYVAASESFGNLMFHSIKILPEVWDSVAKTSREFRLVSPLVQTGHSINWCRASDSSLWTKTLICGSEGALVVVVNEACKSMESGFIHSPVERAEFVFPNLPWMKTSRIYRVDDEKLIPVKTSASGDGVKWTSPTINDGVIYMVCSSARQADSILESYKNRLPKTTPEGMQTPKEDYLKGRRTTPAE